MPEIEGSVAREVSVRLIPVVWGLGEEGCTLRLGAIENMRAYWKREAASAIALSDEDNQTEEIEKRSAAQSMSTSRSKEARGGERVVWSLSAA